MITDTLMQLQFLQCAFSWFTGWLYDALEVYQPSFYLGGTFIVVSAAIIFIPYCKKKYDFNTEASDIYKVEHPDAEDPFLGYVLGVLLHRIALHCSYRQMCILWYVSLSV